MNNTDKNIGLAVIEIKLAINKILFEKAVITEEMHIKAKDIILKS